MTAPRLDGWLAACLRCGARTALGDHPYGCADCARDGYGVPIVPRYEGAPVERPARSGRLWDWAALLPPVTRDAPVTLGEGGTPLVELRWTGAPGRVLLKDERANPTGSFKDRLATVAVTRARSRGARTIAVASSGNAGLAAAAYAAAAGLRCVVLSTPALPGATRSALSALGARTVLVADAAGRWRAVRTGVEQLGWYPLTNFSTPPVSSDVYGVHGYRTIAYEIAAELGWQVPDWVVVPVSRGDALFGVWSGFAELAERGWTSSVPRMLAVERFPSLTRSLADGAEQPSAVETRERALAASIDDKQSTYMALETLRRSRGRAVACDDTAMAAGVREFGRHGVLLELSSAAVLSGLRALVRDGRVSPGSTVVMLGTAGPHAQQTLPAALSAATLADPADAAELARLTGDDG